ncbi:MAG: hypothetical protein OEW89_08510 [Gammaproteobacteria bacterium]|nr:hypothetical protein [Gammaproteobacteria bacterium]MDH5593506.1 hypothetical protein [Gammaproteobacteria bacterium]
MSKHKVNNKLWQWFCIVMMFSVFALPVKSAIPDNIDYQGYLTDSGGSPLNGSVNVTFSLYNVDTGGIALWSNTQAVTVSNGLFEVQLGGLSNPFPLGLFDNPLWLGITVETDGEMSPRTSFSSAAFAFKADDAYTLEGMSASNLDQSGHVADTANPHGVTAAQVGAISASDLTTHAGNTSAHHAKTASFTELADQIADSQIPADVTRDTELVGHAANAGAHHSRYSDAEAVSAVQASGDWVSKAGDTMTGALNVNADINTTSGYQIGGSTVLQTSLANVFLGTDSGINTTGNYNSFSGYQAGAANTTGFNNNFSGFRAGYNNSTGYNNTFSGFSAGFNNTTGIGNTFLGSQAGSNNTLGNYNTFSGYKAGQSNTTAGNNTFFGSFTGQVNTTGYSNTFIGSLAGDANTTGDSNIFIGSVAGSGNKTGRGNTFVGKGAGYSNVSGNANTFSGFEAGNSNVGDSNTFSGYQAGNKNTSGSSNTFTGTFAGFQNTTGYNNTFSGYKAGRSNTTGHYNTFSGYEAGTANTAGFSNTYMGYQAGLSNTTGYYNTFIGRGAGAMNSAGSGNIFLGWRAGYNETGSNKLYIDNSDTSTPLIWGDFASDYMDVNGRLHVKRSVTGVASTTNHVAILENTNTTNDPDVLALKVGVTTAIGSGINFISFKDGNDASLGAIQGNGSGSVVLAGAGNDYAEYLPRVDSEEVIAQGDIVGVFDGKVSKNTQGASRAMVVSSSPIVSGNDPGKGKRAEYSLVAFVGQAEVKVQGSVNAGDYLIPDGKQTGIGIAISPENITAEQFALVVGQAWESSDNTEVKNIRALVGLQHANPVITKLVAENRVQAEEIAKLKSDSRLDELAQKNREQEEELALLRTEIAGVMKQVSLLQEGKQHWHAAELDKKNFVRSAH